MDKRLEKLINPPWLDAIGRLEGQTSIAALAAQESEAMKSVMKLAGSTKLASLTFNESEVIKSVRKFSETTRIASLAFRESEALKSIEKFTKSSRLASLAFQESEAMRSIRIIAESSRIATLGFQNSEVIKQFQSIANTSQFASIAFQQSEAVQQLAKLSKLSSFSALAGLDNSPFPENLTFGLDLVSEENEKIDDNLLDIDSRISAEVNSKTDFNDLSEKTKRILLYLYHYYFLPVILSVFSAYIIINAAEVRKALKSVSTAKDARAFVRSSTSKFDRSALNDFRVTTASSLNFRESPSIKSKIITTLPVGTLVEIIDRSNRSWLLVEMEIDGTLEQGWVFRRYTAFFK